MVVLVVTMTAAACSRGGPAMNLPSVAREVGPAMTRIVAEKDDKDEDTMVKTEGSGMVLTPSGEVLTNAHVVERGFAITAAVPGSATPHPVAILGMDLAADVALVRVLGVSGLPTVRVAGSPQVPVGEEVAAVGYPQGRTSLSVARGRVVGQGRTVVVSGENGLQGLHGVLQIDAPVAPGDSGSALADSSGQVVGMITAGVRGQAGYALPIRTVMGVVDRIRSGRGGRDIVLGLQPYLGVRVVMEARPALSSSGRLYQGAEVVAVIRDSLADLAGLQVGSTVIAVNGQPVTSGDALVRLVQTRSPGERLAFTYLPKDGSEPRTVTVTLGSIAS